VGIIVTIWIKCHADVLDEVSYDQLNNEVDAEDLSESDITSSDGDVDEDSRAVAAALDNDGVNLVAEGDFAIAVARAAQLAGLTVVGSTVTDSAKGLLSHIFISP